MSSFLRRGLAAMMAVASAGTVAAAQTPPRVSPVIQSLQLYADGRTDEAVRLAASNADLRKWRVGFLVDAPSWIAADPSGARRRAAAAMVVELTRARLESDWGVMIDILEWTCTDLRAAGPPTEFERLWHHAVLSLAGRARARLWLFGMTASLPGEERTQIRVPDNGRFPGGHLFHAADRFPDDARIRLDWISAFLWGRDREPTRGAGQMRQLLGARAAANRGRAMEQLEALASDPVVAGDALLLLSRMYFVTGDLPASAAAGRRALDAARDVAGRFSASMSIGRALEAQGKPGDARDAYREALQLIPSAESASIALGGLAIAAGEHDEAETLLGGSFRAGPTSDDPWRLAYYGSFIRWPERLAALREALKK